MTQDKDAIRLLGDLGLKRVYRLGLFGVFLAKALSCAFTRPLKLKLLLKRIHFIGYQSISVIFLTGAFTGMVLGFQGYYSLSKFGSEAFLGPMVALSLIREMGPVIAALMVTARAGSALTAEIGIMRNTEQIDAIEIMGLNPHRYLVAPTIIAGLICLPLLTAIFDVVGIFGGYMVGVKLLGLSKGIYFAEIIEYVSLRDVLDGIFKSLNFGLIIMWICCFKGYYTGHDGGYGAEGVSKSTTQAVVISSVTILVWDYFLTSTLP